MDLSRLGEQTRIELADGRSLWCLVQPEGVTRSLLLAEAPLLPNGAASRRPEGGRASSFPAPSLGAPPAGAASLVEGERQPVAVLSFHASRLGALDAGGRRARPCLARMHP